MAKKGKREGIKSLTGEDVSVYSHSIVGAASMRK